MPWKIEDVDKHNKGLSSAKKKKWVAVANSVLSQCMDAGGDDKKCAPKAIRTANAAVKKTNAKENGLLELFGSSLIQESWTLQEQKVNYDKKSQTIKNVRFIAAGTSKNNRHYTKECLLTLLPFLMEAKVMFVNHRSEMLGRDLNDLISRIVRIEQLDNGDLVGDIKILGNPKYDWLVQLLETDSDILGLSIFAYAVGHRGQVGGKEVEIIDYFIGAHSVDWVYNEGAKGKFSYEENLIFGDEKALSILESMHDMMEVTESQIEEITENFQRFQSVRVLFYLSDWFFEYIFYYVIKDYDLTEDEKWDRINTGFDMFKEALIKTIKDSGAMENPADFSWKFENKSMLEENPEFKNYSEQLKNLIEKFSEELPMNLKELAEKSPEAVALLRVEAMGEAKKEYQELREANDKIVKDIQVKLTASEEKVKTLETSVADLEKTKTELKTTQEKLVVFEKEKVEAEATKKSVERKSHIQKTLETLKVDEKTVPASLKAKLEDVSVYTDKEVTDTLTEIVGARDAQRDEFGISKGTALVDTEVAKGTLEKTESNLFGSAPVKK